jgi:hypothetical protein
LNDLAMEKLDQDILNWIEREAADEVLTQQIKAVRVSKRDYMRTGFFVYFHLPEDVQSLAEGFKASCPHIASPELPDGAGCDLFTRGGRLHYLEIYARGGFFPATLEHYELSHNA